MSTRRRLPAEPPPRRGRLQVAVAVLLTIAVPGTGHLYANFLVRGLVWLAGNIAILLILVQGDVDTGPLVAVLGTLRLVALLDLLVALRLASRADRASGEGGGGR